MAVLVGIAALCAACRATPAALARNRTPPNVLLVTIDTLRADRVGVCGGRAGITPTLDALGKDGAVFIDATAHAPLTLPSHA